MSSHHSIQKGSKPRRSGAGNQLHPKPYLLFDAGGTLVFPDQNFLIQQAREYGIALTHEQLLSGYYSLIYSLDQRAREHGFPCNPWPQGYVYALFETLGLVNTASQAVARVASKRHRQKNLWTFTFSWIRETLSHLAAQGYRMSVISNSDGRTVKVFDDLNLARHFEHIFDSTLLGTEKPDPTIFKLVLRKLNLQPADVLYVGDIFEVDVYGANQAGVGALHLDPLDLYAGWPGVHLPDVRHLPEWLDRYAAAPLEFNLFPTGNPNRMPNSPLETSDFAVSYPRTNSRLQTQTSDSPLPFSPSFVQLRR